MWKMGSEPRVSWDCLNSSREQKQTDGGGLPFSSALKSNSIEGIDNGAWMNISCHNWNVSDGGSGVSVAALSAYTNWEEWKV